MADTCPSPDDLEVLRCSDLFPRRKTVFVDDSDGSTLPAIANPMHGESFLYCGRCGKDNNQFIALTTYRLIVVLPAQWFIVVPVGMLQSVEQYDACTLLLKFKDSRQTSVQFSSNERCLAWSAHLHTSMVVPTKIEDFFAFTFHAWLIDHNEHLSQQSPDSLKWFYDDNGRLGLRDHPLWRTSDENFNFETCQSYPRLTVVPTSTKDAAIRQVKTFRSQGRYPAIVWRNRENGAVLARCSQPLVGLLGYQRCFEDERLVEEIAKAVVLDRALMQDTITRNEAKACTEDLRSLKAVLGEETAAQIEQPSLLVVDMRSYAAAIANRGRGGGTECKDYYPCIEPVYHKVPNIHAVQGSFEALSNLCHNQSTSSSNWMSQLEATQWLHYISGLLDSAVHIAHTLCVDARPVLVHCSDGWDRTTQATALTQLLVDPFYRTFEGFTTLIKREWLSFGHKFATRSGFTLHGTEVSPIFIQWLDAVHQLMRQFPMAFEYNETLLIKLGTHVYSHLFGNFLVNREKDRPAMKVKTLDIWVVLNKQREDFVNYLYDPQQQEIIVPKFGVRHLFLWSRMYMCPVRQVMPGGTNVLEGASLLSPASAGAHDYQESPFEASMRASLQVASNPATLLDCLREQERNKDAAPRSAQPSRRRASHSSALAVAREHITEGVHCARVRSSPPVPSAHADFANGVMSRSPACSIPRTQPADGLSSSFEYVNWSPPIMPGFLSYKPPPILAEARLEPTESSRTCTSSTVQSRHDEPRFCVAKASVISTPGRRRRAAESIANAVAAEDALGASESGALSDSDEGGLSLSTNGGTADDGGVTPLVSSNGSVTAGHVEVLNSGRSAMNGHCLGNGSIDRFVAGSSCHSMSSVSLPCAAAKRPCSLGTSPAALTKAASPRATSAHNLTLAHRVEEGVRKACSREEISTNGCGNGEVTPAFTTAAATAAQIAGDSGYPSSPSSPASSNRNFIASENDKSEQFLISQHLLDVDGLPRLYDPVQGHLYRAKMKKEVEVQVLRNQLRVLRAELKKAALASTSPSALPCLDDCNGGESKAGSLGSMGNPESHGSSASQLSGSWDTPSESDSQPTLWMPDHAVNTCMDCNSTFWMYLRKHHCRSCGGVYCGTCSDYFIPVPKEQLSSPVRVCQRCFDKLDGPLYYRQQAALRAQNAGSS